MGRLLWNIEFTQITHCILRWYLKEQHANKLRSEQYTIILYSIVINPFKLQISC